MALQRARRSAFTLVELLVVIGIIAILIGMLLPALTAARKQANLTKCASGLHQIAYAFTMYSKDNRGMYPVLKWTRPNYTGDNILASMYWNDFLIPYVARGSGENRENLNAGTDSKASQNLDRTKKNIFWSCPEWQGSYGGTTAAWNDASGVSIFETGYGYNCFPFLGPTTSANDYTSGEYWKDEISVDSIPQGIPDTHVTRGSWYSYNKWAPSADRCLVTECAFWFMWVSPGHPTNHFVNPQPANRTTGFSFAASAGWNNIDRYRHGTYPRVRSDGFYDDKDPRGKVKCNILYADGHVGTALSMKEIYRAFILRDP